MTQDLREWLCFGRACCRARLPLRVGATAVLRLARAAFPRHVLRQRWIRYEIDLADTPPPPPHVRLTRVTDPIIGELRQRPDRAETNLKAGLRFWDEGLRRAYIWLGADGPLCIQWLLLPEDNRQLRRLSDWSGMYPPLPWGTGQVDHLFAFSAARPAPRPAARLSRTAGVPGLLPGPRGRGAWRSASGRRPIPPASAAPAHPPARGSSPRPRGSAGPAPGNSRRRWRGPGSRGRSC